MKSHFRFITLSGLAGLMIAGCIKKNDSPAPTFQNIAGTYKATGLIVEQGSQKVNVFDNILLPCEKDNLDVFNKDSSYQYIDTGLVCSPNGSHSSKWSVQGNIITVGNVSATIKSFTGKTMVVAYTNTSVTPTSITTTTYTRQ